MYKRAQAAMEFLMTYGWAILVVLIAIGALAYFGVLNPSRFLPQKCTFSAGVSCGDFILSAGGDTLKLALTNNLGEGVLVTAITATNVDTGTACDVTDLVVTAPGYSWQDGARMDGTALANQLQIGTGTCFANLQNGQRYRVKMTIVYSGSSGISHTVEGEITGRAEA